MKEWKPGENKGVWCGEIAQSPEWSHDLKGSQGDSISFYKFFVKVTQNRKGKEYSSVLPVIISDYLKKEKDLEVGNIVFLKGPWRTYNVYNESGKMHVEQWIFVEKIEVHENYSVNTRNKLEVTGVLVDKLKKPQMKDGKIVRGEDGKPVSEKNEDGTFVFDIREKHGKVLNDYAIAVNRYTRDFLRELSEIEGKKITKKRGLEQTSDENIRALKERFLEEKRKIFDTDHVYCVSYGEKAKYVCDEIDLKTEVKASGFVRERKYKKRQEDGKKVLKTAYEFVVTEISSVE